MKTKAPCKGPGPNGTTCGRPARVRGYCSSHDHQMRSGGKTEATLTVLLPQGGKLYENPSRLEIRNVPREHVLSMARLANEVPAFQTRHEHAANLGARYLVKAWTEGKATLKTSHRPERQKSAPPRRPASDTERVDLRTLDETEKAALEALGTLLPAFDKRDRNLAMRGARWLIQAHHEGGLKIRPPKS